MNAVIQKLLESNEPSVRYKVRVHVQEDQMDSEGIKVLQREITHSPRVKKLLENRRKDGRIEPVTHVYKKWNGAHWILATLADIGYPKGDASLQPANDQVIERWLNPEFIREKSCDTMKAAYRHCGVPVIDGRARRCASQQGNALFSAIALGFMDERCHRLAEYLIRWQWPDGGWNCDKNPKANKSSFWETLIPLRALALYSNITGNQKVCKSVARAAEVFLKRHLYKRQSSKTIMNPKFLQLHYPCYWHYDILFGLKVMAEAGFISDPRCADALDVLESKQLPGGGWPAEERFYKTAGAQTSGYELISWGSTGKTHMNEWVTADALYVLKSAGRLKYMRD